MGKELEEGATNSFVGVSLPESDCKPRKRV